MLYQFHPKNKSSIFLGIDGHGGFGCKVIWTNQPGPHTLFRFANIHPAENGGFNFTLEPYLAPGFQVRIIDEQLKVGDECDYTHEKSISCLGRERK